MTQNNHWKRKFKQQAGFSLIELMIVVGMMSSLTIVITRLLSTMKFNFKRAELSASINQDHLELESLLINSEACRNTFAPLGSLAAATPTTFVPVPALRDGTFPTPVDRLTFPADFPRPPAPAGFTQYTLLNARVFGFNLDTDTPGAPPDTFDVSFHYQLTNLELNPRDVFKRSRFRAVFAGGVVQDCNSILSDDFELLYINVSRNELLNGSLTVLGRIHVEQNAADPANTGYVFAQNFYAASDRTKKENISNADNALELVTQLRGVEFDWIQGQKHDWGVIAQEVQKVIPGLVQDQCGEAGLTVNYNSLTALTMAGLNELRSENEKLAEKVSSLENKVESLKTSACSKNKNYQFCHELKEKKND